MKNQNEEFNFKEEKYKLKFFTEIDNKESKETAELYNEVSRYYNRKKYISMSLLLLVSILIFIIAILIFSRFTTENLKISFSIFTIIGAIIVLLSMSFIINKYNRIIKPYKEIYYQAIENDKTRHKAKIIYKEFERLKNTKEEIITKEKILESNKNREIEKKQLSEEDRLKIQLEKIKQINKNKKKWNFNNRKKDIDFKNNIIFINGTTTDLAKRYIKISEEFKTIIKNIYDKSKTNSTNCRALKIRHNTKYLYSLRQ